MSAVDVSNGEIIITYNTTETNKRIAGNMLYLTPYLAGDNSVAWRCGNAPAPNNLANLMGGGPGTTNITNTYLPKACRT